jgi:hypothetical protein
VAIKSTTPPKPKTLRQYWKDWYADPENRKTVPPDSASERWARWYEKPENKQRHRVAARESARRLRQKAKP